MACIPHEPGSRPQEQERGARSEPDEAQLPTCRVHRTNLHQAKHYEAGLEEGEEYFFVLMTPADPNSFVCVSNPKRVIAQWIIRVVRFAIESSAASSASSQPDTNIENGFFCKLFSGKSPWNRRMLTSVFCSAWAPA